MANQIEPVVVDTAAFYALASTEDHFHSAAVAAFTEIVDTDRVMWTTSYVLVETQALIHRRLGFDALLRFAESIQSGVQTFWIAAREHEQAWSEFLASGGRGLNVVDWTVALVAKQIGAQIFSFDRGFSRAGLNVVPK